MIKLLFLLLIVLLPSLVFGLEKEEFDKRISQIQNKQIEEVEAFLDSNKNKLSKDPNYYVILINFTNVKAERSHLVVAKGEPQGGDFSLHDMETGETVGFLGTRGGYDETIIKDCISKVNAALPHFKERLDIHFGLVALAERINDWTLIGNQLIQIIDTSKQINNEWTWGPIGSMSGDPKNFMLDNVESRVYKMFYENTEIADDAMVKISESLIKHYPDSIYGYANLGTFHFAKKDYQKAKEYYKLALKIDPNDRVVNANLKKLNEIISKNDQMNTNK